MTTARLLGTLLLATSVVLGRSAMSTADSVENSADLDAIRQVITGTTTAFNRHDAKAFASYYTPDAWVVTVRGESMAGTAEIEKQLTAISSPLEAHRPGTVTRWGDGGIHLGRCALRALCRRGGS